MNLTLKGFSQIIEDMSAALQSSASALIDVSVGSVLRALFEANASVVLWLQWLVLQVLQTTRASTSSGSDLDSWMADFGLSRLAPTPSTGLASFSRFSPTLAATIPVGTIVKTTDGTLSFAVTEDVTLSTWQPNSASYVIPAGVSSVNLPVACTTSGSIGNVLPNTVTVISAPLPGIDQVDNGAPFSDGIDQETDQAFRIRFQTYLSTRSLATLAAVKGAIAAVQQGIEYLVIENAGPSAGSQPGSFLVVVDDGSGYPPSSLLSKVASSVDNARPIGTMFSVVPPSVLTVNVSLIVTLISGTSSQAAPAAQNAIQSAIAAYLNGLPIGKAASVTRTAQQAYAASESIDNISGILLNSSGNDIIPPPLSVIKAGQISVIVNGG